MTDGRMIICDKHRVHVDVYKHHYNTWIMTV